MGYFEEDIPLPVLKERDNVWISPAISEIKSMKGGIEKRHCECLTMGLVIRFLPSVWLLKEEVESVTVIEFNHEVIDLFEKYIRPCLRLTRSLKQYWKYL